MLPPPLADVENEATVAVQVREGVFMAFFARHRTYISLSLPLSMASFRFSALQPWRVTTPCGCGSCIEPDQSLLTSYEDKVEHTHDC